MKCFWLELRTNNGGWYVHYYGGPMVFDAIDRMRDWCENIFTYKSNVSYDISRIFNEDDLMLFMLTWGEYYEGHVYKLGRL